MKGCEFKVKPKKYDFSGWATRINIKCSDGRTIKDNAFKDCDGKTVPLVWNHDHDQSYSVLGHAYLENRPGEGIYTYGSFNDTDSGQNAKLLVEHKDIVGLSIYANKLKQNGGDVIHGVIREVSLVLAGANPGAYIDTIIEHSDDSDEEAIMSFISEDGNDLIVHSEEDEETEESEETESSEDEVVEHADEKEEKETEKVADEKKSDKTVKDVFDTLTEEQKTVVYYLIGQAASGKKAPDKEDSDEKEEKEMKHNVFEKNEGVLHHSLTPEEYKVIFADAKKVGSLKEAVLYHCEEGMLAHADGDDEEQPYGIADIETLFPEARIVNGTEPEFIQRNMEWVSVVMNGVSKSPFSRVKTQFADITEDAARAKGYIKGKMKKEEVFTLLKRSTDPQTIYKKQKLDRDDIIDITDFSVVAWIKKEMRMMFEEEAARAMLIGDGRLPDDDDKIQEAHVRPIYNDANLFTIKAGINVPAGADEDAIAKATIRTAIKARKQYKGSGSPILFTTEDYLTNMLLLEDGLGHPLYKTEQELATRLRVSRIVTVEPMEGLKLNFATDTPDAIVNKPVVGVIVNLRDYKVGADKGGEVNFFDDFDIDYNQYKYLYESRFSGALTKPYSAITLYLNEAEASGDDSDNSDDSGTI